MANDIVITEKTYSTSEVASLIGKAPVTVRKYSQLLEEKGYVFIRSQVKARQKARLYRYKDIETLRYLTNIRKEGRITVEEAINITIERLGKGDIQDIASTDIEKREQYSNQYSELIAIIKKQGEEISRQSQLLVNQRELILNLTVRLDKQEKQISQLTGNNETEAPKDIQTLKEIKAPKQIEAPKEIETPITGIEAGPKEENKKGFFSKLVDIFLIDTRNNK